MYECYYHTAQESGFPVPAPLLRGQPPTSGWLFQLQVLVWLNRNQSASQLHRPCTHEQHGQWVEGAESWTLDVILKNHIQNSRLLTREYLTPINEAKVAHNVWVNRPVNHVYRCLRGGHDGCFIPLKPCGITPALFQGQFMGLGKNIDGIIKIHVTIVDANNIPRICFDGLIL